MVTLQWYVFGALCLIALATTLISVLALITLQKRNRQLKTADLRQTTLMRILDNFQLSKLRPHISAIEFMYLIRTYFSPSEQEQIELIMDNNIDWYWRLREMNKLYREFALEIASGQSPRRMQEEVEDLLVCWTRFDFYDQIFLEFMHLNKEKVLSLQRQLTAHIPSHVLVTVIRQDIDSILKQSEDDEPYELKRLTEYLAYALPPHIDTEDIISDLTRYIQNYTLSTPYLNQAIVMRETLVENRKIRQAETGTQQ